MNTYSWVPPRPPVAQTRRRMLRHNANESWDKMQVTAGLRCRPPVLKEQSFFFAKTDGPSSLPLTWVRVPPGALQNGTNTKYASNTSRFSVN